MSVQNKGEFQIINKHKIHEYIYEIIAFEDVLLNKDEEFNLGLDLELRFLSDYIGFILTTRENQEYIEFSPEQISSMKSDLTIDIKYTGENAIQIKKN